MIAGYRTFGLLLLVCSAGFVSATSEVHTATPIEKVVQLLKKLSAEIEEEGKVEAAEYDKYACFCKEQADEKQYAIETSEKKIKVAEAKEDELKKAISELGQEITDLSKKISDYEKEIKADTEKRAEERKTYETQAKDLLGAISACERAIEAMKDSKSDIVGKVDLAQLSASSPRLADELLAFVGAKQVVSNGKQEPASFQYSSNEILATLEGLLAKFKKNKVELDETEFNTKASFEMKMQDLNNQKSFAEKDKFEKEEQSESLGETLADTTEEKNEEEKAKKADGEFMEVLTADCEAKAGEFDQRSKARADELTAITKALDDLEANAVGNYDANKKLVGLQIQKTSGQAAPSFLQVRGSPRKASLLAKASSDSSRIAATQNVLDLLLKKVEKSHSPVLASITMKLTLFQNTGIDHFVKVRQLIKDLLKKLDADAKEEATQKAYCDTNMEKQTKARDDAKAKIEEKEAGITTATADLAETKEKIAELQQGIATNMKGLKEASELREEEKAANAQTVAMSEEGKKSVEFALTVLKEFYNKAAKEALVQKGLYTPPKAGRDGMTVGDLAPKTSFSGKYGGNQDASKGIIGILEVIAADFQRTTDQVEADEEAAEKKYQEFKKTTEEDNEAKNKELKLAEKRVSDLGDTLVGLKDDLKAAQDNLESALTTLEDLKKMCVDGEETYEERVAKRKEEIDALKEALEILENWKS